MTDPALTVVAYAVHPFSSAEGTVNGALLDELRRAGRWRLSVVTSPAGYEPVGPAEGHVDVRPVPLPGGLALATTRPPRDAAAVVARVVDRVRSAAGLDPIGLSAWARAAAATILDGHDPAGVVWARATPTESFAAAAVAHRRRSFALVANYNDPLPVEGADGSWTSTDRALVRAQARLNEYLAAHADAFTFSNARLRDHMARRARLDGDRCFVIPHLVPAARAADRPVVPTDRRARLLYTGTLYPAVLDAPVWAELDRRRAGGRLELQIAARRPRPDVEARLRSLVPEVDLRTDQTPDQLAALVDEADALLVVDHRSDLLLTKVVDAVHRRRPVLAVVPAGSVSAAVLHEAGAIVAEPTAPSVAAGLDALDAVVRDAGSLGRALDRGDAVRARLAPAAVLDRVDRVLDFAAARHEALAAGRPVPAPPTIDDWP